MDFQPLRPTIVLGIAAHPDDLDVNAGGTMAWYASQGADVYYLILTNGCNGTADRTVSAQQLTLKRQQEQRDAARQLGAKDVLFCTYPDGCLENCKDVRRDIVRVIRQLKPDVVITWDPSMFYCTERAMINHPDHRASGQAALDAVYPLARDHLSFPELLEQGFEPHKTATVLLINFNQANFFVDITPVLEKKLHSIAAHSSQMPDFEEKQAQFIQYAEELGQACGVRYAETFMRIDVL